VRDIPRRADTTRAGRAAYRHDNPARTTLYYL